MKKNEITPIFLLAFLLITLVLLIELMGQRQELRKQATGTAPAKLLGRVVDVSSSFQNCPAFGRYYFGGNYLCPNTPLKGTCWGESDYTITWIQGDQSKSLRSNSCYEQDGIDLPRYTFEDDPWHNSPLGSPQGEEITVRIQMDGNVRLVRWYLETTAGDGQILLEPDTRQSGIFSNPGPNQEITVKVHNKNGYDLNHLWFFASTDYVLPTPTAAPTISLTPTPVCNVMVPSDYTATRLTDTNIDLIFYDNSRTESNFRIERRIGTALASMGAYIPWTLSDPNTSTDSTVTGWVDAPDDTSAPIYNVCYQWRVRAEKDLPVGCFSGWTESNILCVEPMPTSSPRPSVTPVPTTTIRPTPTSSPSPSVTPTLIATPSPLPASPTPIVGGPHGWYQVQGGDVHAQEVVSSNLPQAKLFYTDVISDSVGVVSYGQDVFFNSARFSAANWLARQFFGVIPRRTYTYYYGLLGSPNDSFVADSLLGNGIYYSSSGVEINQIEFQTDRTKAVILVNGDLDISRNIIVPVGNFLGFIVSGDIRINGSVDNIQGFYLADGEFNTGSSAVKLVGEGVFVANNFILGRDLGDDNLTTAAEEFRLRPDFLMNSFFGLWRAPVYWQEIAP